MMTSMLREQGPAHRDHSAKLGPQRRVTNRIKNQLDAVDAEVGLTKFLVAPTRNADGGRNLQIESGLGLIALQGILEIGNSREDETLEVTAYGNGLRAIVQARARRITCDTLGVTAARRGERR